MFGHNPRLTLELQGWLLHGLGLLVTMLAAGVFYVFGYQPLDGESASLQAQALMLDGLLNQATTIYAENSRLKTQVNEFERKAIAVLSRVPEEPREADFLAQVSELAQQTGLDILDYRPGILRPQTTYTEMEVKLVSKGTYASLCGFLEQIDRLPRLCRLMNLSIDAKASDGKYAMEMTLVIFFTTGSKAPSNEAGNNHG